MRKFLFPASVLFFVFYIQVPAQAIDLNPFSALKSAVEAAVEDRSSSDIAADLEIKAKITAAVIDKMGSDVISINADVYEQTVMLTGSVETAAQKEQAGKLSAATEGVKKTYNEIRVQKSIDKDKGMAESFVDDTIIESKINALLLDASGVNVTNFRWRSVDGHVYLFGRAFSQKERDKAARIVRGIKNVRSLTNRVMVRAKN
ncbi:MAG TPA: BON domain-containing protein [Rhodospirillales bacterium]|nr:BON domain-containing protein [Rhodospirillales bacterium]